MRIFCSHYRLTFDFNYQIKSWANLELGQFLNKGLDWFWKMNKMLNMNRFWTKKKLSWRRRVLLVCRVNGLPRDIWVIVNFWGWCYFPSILLWSVDWFWDKNFRTRKLSCWNSWWTQVVKIQVFFCGSDFLPLFNMHSVDKSYGYILSGII